MTKLVPLLLRKYHFGPYIFNLDNKIPYLFNLDQLRPSRLIANVFEY